VFFLPLSLTGFFLLFYLLFFLEFFFEGGTSRLSASFLSLFFQTLPFILVYTDFQVG